MYFEARGPAHQPTVICSAISRDMLHWDHEDGIRLQGVGGLGGPRYLVLPDGRGRLYCFASEWSPAGSERSGAHRSQNVVSAISDDGLNFEFEPGYRMQDQQSAYDTAGITAAEVIPPSEVGDNWTMFFSAWQDVPAGTMVPLHPSLDPNAMEAGSAADFAAASIATDMAGYRSRIFTAHSADGLRWDRAECVIEGTGYGGAGLDAVHAEDMSLIKIDRGSYRMYYAACDKDGNWRIASAVAEVS